MLKKVKISNLFSYYTDHEKTLWRMIADSEKKVWVEMSELAEDWAENFNYEKEEWVSVIEQQKKTMAVIELFSKKKLNELWMRLNSETLQVS